MHVLRCSHRSLRSAFGALRLNSVAHRLTRALPLGLLSAAALTACKEAADPEPVASIIGLNPTDSVRLGKTRGFQVETRDASGNKLTGRTITWTSLNPNVVAVDANGVATGLAIGSTVVTARSGNASATTDVTVQPLATSLVLLPGSSTLQVNASRQMTVALTGANGQSIAGRLVTYSSSNASVATVNASGVVVGVAPGRATITGESPLDQVSGTATVDVIPVAVTSISITPPGAQTAYQGLTLQLAATLRDASGTILNGRTVSWTSSNPSIATVTSSGLVTGVSLGQVQITAESEGVTGATTVTVAPRPVATVSLTPSPASVKVGQSTQLSLDIRDANGNQLTTTGRTVTWDSSNKPVATVVDGVVTGVSVGTANISVTVDGKPATIVVSVTP
jgi:uncharacterized protein YjdB